MSYTVQTKVFEGPFDLLLHLILKDDVDLYEVDLTQIVDAYLAELSKMDECDLDVATEFLLIASTLVELKCRRLLPAASEAALDEELGIWEERDQLLARLLECKTFKDAAQVIEELLSGANLSVPRSVGLEEPYIDLTPDPLSGMTADRLQRAFIKLASPKPVPEVSLHHVAQLRWSVPQAIERISSRLQKGESLRYRDIVDASMERLEIVVHFLAILELFKQGIIDIEQSKSDGELRLSPVTVSVTQSIDEVDTYDG